MRRFGNLLHCVLQFGRSLLSPPPCGVLGTFFTVSCSLKVPFIAASMRRSGNLLYYVLQFCCAFFIIASNPMNIHRLPINVSIAPNTPIIISFRILAQSSVFSIPMSLYVVMIIFLSQLALTNRRHYITEICFRQADFFPQNIDIFAKM